MMTAREQFESGTQWIDHTARLALPVLLRLAMLPTQNFTYRELELEVAQRADRKPLKVVVSYGKVLGKIGELLNQLSSEWQEEIPPLTVLITNKNSGLPSHGVDDFLQRYITKCTNECLTEQNRSDLIALARKAIYKYQRWKDVADHFGINVFTPPSNPIFLPKSPQMFGGESKDHLELKKYVASHPELFVHFGDFAPGEIEVKVDSGDEVDVLFRNAEQALAVEVKTANAPPGELTRGIFQCVKYRAVLSAMDKIAGKSCVINVVLATPQHLIGVHVDAAQRLDVNWQQIEV